VLALGAPDDLAGLVVGDQGQVLVVPAPRNLVDPDVDQIREPVRVELVGDDPAADRADGAPGDPAEHRHGGLVGLGGQPYRQVLEVAGEPGSGSGEVHRLDQHPVLGASQPPAAHREHTDASTQVEVPPRRVNLPGVVAVHGREGAVRAPHPAAVGAHRHPHPIVGDLDVADGGLR
jgi:hypothetical protein